MATLTQKTTILLSLKEHRLLLQEARKRQVTMGEAVRLAIRKLYMRAPRSKNNKLWNKLFKSHAPVSDWEQMEKEILKGRF